VNIHNNILLPFLALVLVLAIVLFHNAFSILSPLYVQSLAIYHGRTFSLP
jgi:hypothetical protein